MNTLAPTLQAFFMDRLLAQRQASPRTVAAYRDTFRLLLQFICGITGKGPVQLELSDLDATRIGDFLQWLEDERDNSIRTRNARLAAIHSFFRYAALRHPEHAHNIQRVLGIPFKRHERRTVDFLTREEVDALLAAVDRSRWTGRRDYTLLVLAVQTGLRVSEVTGLKVGDVQLGTGACVRCHGKGRKHRATPLTASTVTILQSWLQERNGHEGDPLFPTIRGSSLSSDTVQWLLNKYTDLAARHCPTLASKHVTPHILRHTCAMNLLVSGVDLTVIALWLGHESIQTTQIYVHADMTLKEQAIARAAPPNTQPGRYRPPDTLLAFLESL
ncbi:MAG: site-specific integrase [Alicyclobacillus sp.]|nr:site-specific integrase [Alicyclobacillus sp.]